MAELWVLRAAYGELADVLSSVTPEEQWRPTGCTGWSVLDLALHLVEDAHRALVALATPVEGPPVVDAVAYWRPDAPPSGEEADDLVAVRVAAAVQGGIEVLARRYATASAAVLVAAGRVPAGELVGNQGAPMTLSDLTSTLVVEATVHHLDLVRHLDRPGPVAGPLAEVRRVFEGLFGGPLPAGWDDATAALRGAGREPLTEADRAELGAAAGRLPVLG
ncbi:maleylpyruvate isomerase N-terminal domain-containing protein [Geodermatophilus sp. SYSU D00691]